jgi:hypothetical protein
LSFSFIYFWCFIATFSNISAISWRPVLVVEEAGVPGENHRPWASNWVFKRDLPQYISFILAVGYCLRKRYQSLANFITLISFEWSLQTSGNRTHNCCGDN